MNGRDSLSSRPPGRGPRPLRIGPPRLNHACNGKRWLIENEVAAIRRRSGGLAGYIAVKRDKEEPSLRQQVPRVKVSKPFVTTLAYVSGPGFNLFTVMRLAVTVPFAAGPKGAPFSS